MSRQFDEDYDFLFKIVLIGDSGVGKTNILAKFTKNEFALECKPTIGVEFATKTINVCGKSIKCQIWDTAGQERYRAITNAYYRGAVGALVCFDLTRTQTYENTAKWMNELKEHGDPNIIVTMIGNKLDLQDKRTLRQDDALQLCESKQIAYIETSAMDGTNINQAFEQIATQIYQKIGNKLEADLKQRMDSDVVTLEPKQTEKQDEKKACC